ncbi:MAG: hypothetical protein ABI200_05375 [Gaiellales bacterium]
MITTYSSSQHDLATQLNPGERARREPAGGSFAELLQEGFRARAAQLGLELPAPSPATSPGAPADADAASADAAWEQAKLRSIAAGHGPGDAMLKMLGEAAAARHERRHQPLGLFDL